MSADLSEAEAENLPRKKLCLSLKHKKPSDLLGDQMGASSEAEEMFEPRGLV